MKRFICILCALACVFVLPLAACSDAGQGGDDGSQAGNAEEQQGSSSDTSADDPTDSEVDVEKIDYSEGTHIARVTIEGYASFEIELYADYAPRTVAKFAKLVNKGYYDGKTLYALLPDMYARIGDASGKQAGKQTVKGEYEEAGISNALTLKRGVLAMGRTTSGTKSDASQLILCLSDLSYLDGKYAAFGKVSDDGMEAIDDIAGKINNGQSWQIEIDKKGNIKKKTEQPVITSIEMVE